MSVNPYDFSLEVTEAPNWFLTLSQTSIRVAKGNSASVTVTAFPLYGFVGDINLYVIALPKGVNAAFVPPLIPQDGSSTLTIETLKMPVKINPLQVLGISDGPIVGDYYICGNTPSEISAMLPNVPVGGVLYMLENSRKVGYKLAWGTMAERPATGTSYTAYYATDIEAIYYAGATGAWEIYNG